MATPGGNSLWLQSDQVERSFGDAFAAAKIQVLIPLVTLK